MDSKLGNSKKMKMKKNKRLLPYWIIALGLLITIIFFTTILIRLYYSCVADNLKLNAVSISRILAFDSTKLEVSILYWISAIGFYIGVLVFAIGLGILVWSFKNNTTSINAKKTMATDQDLKSEKLNQLMKDHNLAFVVNQNKESKDAIKKTSLHNSNIVNKSGSKSINLGVEQTRKIPLDSKAHQEFVKKNEQEKLIQNNLRKIFLKESAEHKRFLEEERKRIEFEFKQREELQKQKQKLEEKIRNEQAENERRRLETERRFREESLRAKLLREQQESQNNELTRIKSERDKQFESPQIANIVNDDYSKLISKIESLVVSHKKEELKQQFNNYVDALSSKIIEKMKRVDNQKSLLQTERDSRIVELQKQVNNLNNQLKESLLLKKEQQTNANYEKIINDLREQKLRLELKNSEIQSEYQNSLSSLANRRAELVNNRKSIKNQSILSGLNHDELTELVRDIIKQTQEMKIR